MQVVFVADFFSDQILGGAESNDSVLISYLESNNFNVVKKHSAHCTLQALQAYKDEFFIISNFVGLSEASKQYITENCNYIIYENDHKYVATRDPSKFKNFDIPSAQVVNYHFYNKAKKVIVLSQICKDVLEKNKSVKQLKGDSRPFFKQHDRKYALECCRYVDRVIIFDEKTPYNLIKQLKPDIIVKGGDYRKEDVVGHDIAEVRIFNFVEGYSTSKVLKAQENNDV